MTTLHEDELGITWTLADEHGVPEPPVREPDTVVVREGVFPDLDFLRERPRLTHLVVERTRAERAFDIGTLPGLCRLDVVESPDALNLRASRRLSDLRITGQPVLGPHALYRLRGVVEVTGSDALDPGGLFAGTRVAWRPRFVRSRIVGGTEARVRCYGLTLNRCLVEDWSWLAGLVHLRSLTVRGDDFPPAALLLALPCLQFVHVSGDLAASERVAEYAASGRRVTMGRGRSPFVPRPRKR